MARDSLNAEIARQRQDELRRIAERHSSGAESFSTGRSTARTKPQEAVTIGRVAADGGRELDLLARVRRRVLLRVIARLSRSLIAR